jgi:hypothetical protein
VAACHVGDDRNGKAPPTREAVAFTAQKPSLL